MAIPTGVFDELHGRLNSRCATGQAEPQWNLHNCIAVVPQLLDFLFRVSAVLRANLLDSPSPQVGFVVNRAVLPAQNM